MEDVNETEEMESEMSETNGLSSDMLTFISRVAERLAPTKGLNPEAKARCLKVQEQFRRELVEVFQGKRNFSEWYDQKKTDLGLHHYTFMKILYESLEGLKSPKAQELREQYAQTLRRMRTL